MASAAHTANELMATARPAIRVGKTSDMKTHLIGPIEKAKQATKVAAAATFMALEESGRLKSTPREIREMKHPRLPQNKSGRRPTRSISHTARRVKMDKDEAITTMPLISLARWMPWPRMISGPKFQIVVMPLNSETTARNSAMSKGRRRPG